MLPYSFSIALNWSNRILIAFATSLLTIGSRAEIPTLTHLYPSAVKIGETTEVELIGEFKDWPPQVWVDQPDTHVSFSETKGRAEITIDKDAIPGPRLIRCFNLEGSSAPVFFLGSSLSQHNETEPNDSGGTVQPLHEDATIVNGRLEKRGDVDSYAVSLESGQWLVVDTFAYRLRSSIDALVQIITPDGRKAAFNHDHFHLDPFIAHQATEPGRYEIQIMGFDYPAKSDIRFGGSKTAVYQMHVFSSPVVQHTFPFAVERDTKTSVQLVGWNLDKGEQRIESGTHSELPLTSLMRGEHPNGSSPPFNLATTEYAQKIDTQATPQTAMSIPSAISGLLTSDFPSRQYEISLEKDQWYSFELRTEAPIHRLHSWIELQTIEGKTLKRAYDSDSGLRPSFQWKATETAIHRLKIGNLLEQAAKDYYYHLTVTQPPPAFKAELALDQITLHPGTTNQVSVSLNRLNGHTAPIEFSFKNLPSSIEQRGGKVAEKETKVHLELVTLADAVPFLGEITLWATDLSSGKHQAVPATLLGTSVNNGVPGGYRDLLVTETSSLWLTIPRVEPQAQSEPPQGTP